MLQTVEDPREQKTTLLFVDDEKRVLTSMRAMFRRDYHVLLANSGAEAIELIRANDVKLIVSDQRMPSMTGVEVLTKARELAPNAMRILLTGYADLKAIEDSINKAEVFKYLMKPCPTDELRAAVSEALSFGEDQQALAQELAQASTLAPPRGEELPVVKTEEELNQAVVVPLHGHPSAGEQEEEVKRAALAMAAIESVPEASPPHRSKLIVLSDDDELIEGVRTAAPANSICEAAGTVGATKELLRQGGFGVLVTDCTVDTKLLHSIVEDLRTVEPALVVILASARSDATRLIELINSGEVFRFLIKPVQQGQCKIWLASALQRYAQKRTTVEAIESFTPEQTEDVATEQKKGSGRWWQRLVQRITRR